MSTFFSALVRFLEGDLLPFMRFLIAIMSFRMINYDYNNGSPFPAVNGNPGIIEIFVYPAPHKHLFLPAPGLTQSKSCRRSH